MYMDEENNECFQVYNLFTYKGLQTRLKTSHDK